MDEIIIDKGCGLDVHKETVVACVMGSGIKKEIRTFSTMTEDLFRLKSWLSENGYYPRCDGEYRALLEAGVQYFGGFV